MNTFTLKAIFMSLLPFYRADFPIEDFPIALAYVEYKQGHQVGKKSLVEEERSALKEFFIKNGNGWRYDVATYAYGRLFTSPAMQINCLHDGSVVVNYAAKGEGWVQISKKDLQGSCPAIVPAAAAPMK